jgi:hypothetical protein
MSYFTSEVAYELTVLSLCVFLFQLLNPLTDFHEIGMDVMTLNAI